MCITSYTSTSIVSCTFVVCVLLTFQFFGLLFASTANQANHKGYYIKMTSWNKTLPDTLTNSECERGDVTKQGGAPPVRIIPPKKEEDPSKKKSMVTFYVGEDQSTKESYEKFEDSNAENGLKHVRFFNQLISKRGTKALIEEQVEIRDDAIAALQVMEEGDHGHDELIEDRDAAIFEIERLVTEVLDTFEQLLGAALVPDWEENCRKMLDTNGYINEEDTWINHRALGKTGWHSIHVCLNGWLCLNVPKDCAERNRRYLSTQIVFPPTGHTKQVKIKPFLLRIKSLNELTTHMPCLKDTKNAPASMPRANVPFPEYEMCTYLLNACPVGMKEMYWSRKGQHFPCNVDQLIEDLHMMAKMLFPPGIPAIPLIPFLFRLAFAGTLDSAPRKTHPEFQLG